MAPQSLPPASSQGQMEAEDERSPMARILSITRRFGMTLLGEALIFWFILLAFQFLGYGGRPGRVKGPAWELFQTLLLAYLAMASGGDLFRLFTRLWPGAGINDPFSVML